VNLRFIGSVAVISPDPSASHQLYVDTLGWPLAGEPDGYLHSENIEGSKSFGIWPLSQAAQVCFGTMAFLGRIGGRGPGGPGPPNPPATRQLVSASARWRAECTSGAPAYRPAG
jgi:hypothetical protein